MVKNIKRYQKQQRRDPAALWSPDELDIIPATYVLPQVWLGMNGGRGCRTWPFLAKGKGARGGGPGGWAGLAVHSEA